MQIWRRRPSPPRSTASEPVTPETLLEQALGWFLATYGERRYFVGRDVVWTIQTWLQRRVSELDLAWQVRNDYPVLLGKRRAPSADLGIAVDGEAALLVELRYEPSHRRTDVAPESLPMIGWQDVEKDAERVRRFVGTGRAPVAMAILIDEGGFYRTRPALPSGHWVDLGSPGGDPSMAVSVHVVRVASP
jgi:hypothetical protein